jgi:phosphinothricin acetyltransferase
MRMLRLAVPSDGARLAAIYAPAVTERATSFELTPPDAVEMGRRVATLLARTPWLVAEDDDGLVVGYAYASPHRDRHAYQWSVEVSAYVDNAVHRAGRGRALYSALFQILIAQGFVNAYAGITLPNPASVGFHKAMGFEEIGVYRGVGYKFGRWHDVAWFHMPLAPQQPGVQPPRALPDLVLREELGDVLTSPP